MDDSDDWDMEFLMKQPLDFWVTMPSPRREPIVEKEHSNNLDLTGLIDEHTLLDPVYSEKEDGGDFHHHQQMVISQTGYDKNMNQDINNFNKQLSQLPKKPRLRTVPGKSQENKNGNWKKGKSVKKKQQSDFILKAQLEEYIREQNSERTPPVHSEIQRNLHLENIATMGEAKDQDSSMRFLYPVKYTLINPKKKTKGRTVHEESLDSNQIVPANISPTLSSEENPQTSTQNTDNQ